MKPRVSIVIPVYNQIILTQKCLEAIAATTQLEHCEIIVVDDASTDYTPQFLEALALKSTLVRVVTNPVNRGFATTCNKGAKAAVGDYILFLNNDTEPKPGWLPPLEKVLDSNADIGVVAPKLVHSDGTIQHCGKVWEDTDSPRSQPHHLYYRFPSDYPATNKSREFALVTGACIMVRREEFIALGSFDEGYENGWEDDDLCYRYRTHGMKVYYCSESVVVHHESMSLAAEVRQAERALNLMRHKKSLSGIKYNDAFENDLELFIEQRLLGVRKRFHYNRSRFMEKWSGVIERDDYHYYQEDALAEKTGENSSAIIANHNQISLANTVVYDHKPVVIWEGSQFVKHSLALVNRELCLALLNLQVSLSIIPYEPDDFEPSIDDRYARLVPFVNSPPSGSPDICIRHQWPANLTPPPQGHWVMIQPWEFGSLPVKWIPAMSTLVDEIWVYTNYLRDCYISSGVPEEIVKVIPLGTNMERFNPNAKQFSLKTNKRFKFLFVGGTIRRKGIDILINSYLKTFSAKDDVCLVVKDMGSSSFYSGLSISDLIGELQKNHDVPEIELIDQMLSEEDMAGIYTACNCLVHPYRGEGFGLPIAEAMASGLPVIVTGFGAAMDFCSEENAFLLPACKSFFTEKEIDGIETTDYPWLAEPDADSLIKLLRYVFEHEDEALKKAKKALEQISIFSWENAAKKALERMYIIRNQPIRRMMTEQISQHNIDIGSSQMPDKSVGNIIVPEVSIVILTYNQLEYTKLCVASIERNTPESHEIIFVDNGSSDGSVAWLENIVSNSTSYHLIKNKTNLGFSKGCNQGIEASVGSYILLLNNDTVVTPGWLSGLLENFDTPNIGIVGPMTNKISGIQEWPWCDYNSLDELDAFSEKFTKTHRYRRIPSRRIVGFCMLFRRSLIEHIGLLDEKFGSGNMEDDDLCLRAALEGYNNLIAGDVFIHHFGSATFIGNSLDYTSAILKNHAVFNEKWSQPVVDVKKAKKIIALRTLETARKLSQTGEKHAAVDLLLQDGIAQLPDEPRIYLALASIFLELEMPEDALDVLRESPEICGETVIITIQAMIDAGMLSNASRLLDDISINCDPIKAVLLHGQLLLKLNDLNAAGAAFEKALEKAPGSAEAYFGLATLAQKIGDFELAFLLAEKAFCFAPTDSRIRILFLSLASNSEKIASAEQRVREACYFYPDDSGIAYTHVDLLLRQKRQKDAMPIIERMLADFKVDDGFQEAALAVRAQIGSMKIDPARYKKGIAVSLCMIMKNEAANLARCLLSLKPIVDEIIIVDTGSSDDSLKIAQIYGAEVIEAAWNGDFSAARNISLQHARGNWILVMDADEIISSMDYKAFRLLIENSVEKKISYTLETRNYTNRVDLENWQANRGEYSTEEAGRGWMPSDKIRLFPNLKSIRFENPIHEMVESSVARLGMQHPKVDIPVHHFGYLDDQRQQRKLQYYYELGKKKLDESGGAPHAVVELAIQAAGIGLYDEAVDLWLRALEFDPVSSLAFFNLGHAYLQKGMFVEGRNASQRAMQLRDNYREALINKLVCELCLGCGDELLEVIEVFSLSNPDYPLLQLMHGVVKAVVGKTDEALEDFHALLSARIDFSRFIHEVAVKLIMANRAEEVGRLILAADLAGICLPETTALLEK